MSLAKTKKIPDRVVKFQADEENRISTKNSIDIQWSLLISADEMINFFVNLTEGLCDLSTLEKT